MFQLTLMACVVVHAAVVCYRGARSVVTVLVNTEFKVERKELRIHTVN